MFKTQFYFKMFPIRLFIIKDRAKLLKIKAWLQVQAFGFLSEPLDL